jgi:hypothetical protein
MIAAPPAFPCTTLPIAIGITVAMAVLLVLHIPPPVASANVVVYPKHTSAVPVIAAGKESTTTVPVTVQPTPSE